MPSDNSPNFTNSSIIGESAGPANYKLECGHLARSCTRDERTCECDDCAAIRADYNQRCVTSGESRTHVQNDDVMMGLIESNDIRIGHVEMVNGQLSLLFSSRDGNRPSEELAEYHNHTNFFGIRYITPGILAAILGNHCAGSILIMINIICTTTSVCTFTNEDYDDYADNDDNICAHHDVHCIPEISIGATCWHPDCYRMYTFGNLEAATIDAMIDNYGKMIWTDDNSLIENLATAIIHIMK